MDFYSVYSNQTRVDQPALPFMPPHADSAYAEERVLVYSGSSNGFSSSSSSSNVVVVLGVF